MAAGCSSDVSRFDYPSFGLTTQSSGPTVPSEPVYQGPAYQGPYGQGGYSDNGYQSGGYGAPGTGPDAYAANPYRPDRRKPYTGSPGYVAPGGQTPDYGGYGQDSSADGARAVPYGTYEPSPDRGAPRQRYAAVEEGQAFEDDALAAGPKYKPVPTVSAFEEPAPRKRRGGTIVVREGDTLYRIARDNGVSMSELMAYNGLKSPKVELGQTIVIPLTKGRYDRPQLKRVKVEATPAEEPVVEADGLAGGETYTVRGGETLYGIAKKLGLSAGALADENGITDAGKLKQGQVLRLPQDGAGVAEVPIASKQKRLARLQPAETSDEESAEAFGSDAEASSQEASTEEVDTETEAPVASKATRKSAKSDAIAAIATSETDVEGSGRFRWPARGRIVSKFGQSVQGSRNEGINVAVPLGTEVHAAEAGVVAYAGDELKGYGKLVLIRHADNWVSAYAHNEEIIVKRGQQIERGQVIAKAGKTGAVDQPQIHFELRKGSQPVDPLPHLASN